MALDALRSGFVTLCIDPNLNYYDPQCKVLIEGQLPDAPTDGSVTYAAADQVIEVPSAGQAAGMFGNGVLAASVAKAFCACPSGVNIFVLPRTPDVSDVAAVYTMTFDGTATTPGRVQIFALDADYIVDIMVNTGDTAAMIATQVAAAYNALPGFPYTAVADTTTDANVILTAVDRGTIGNYLNPIYNYTGRPNVAPGGITMAVVRTTAGTGTWTLGQGQDYATVLGECCYDCYAPLTGDTSLQTLLQKWLEDAWDCTKPQCFGHGYVWNEGTLGMVLATGTNAAVFNRLAYPVNDSNAPYFLIVDYAARSCCTACTNPEVNIQGETYGVLSCVSRPASCSQPWAQSDRQQLSAAGFVTWGPAQMGSGANLTNPMIYEDITNYLYDTQGRSNATYRSTSITRWAKSFALYLASFIETTFDGLSFFEDGTQIREGVRATTRTLAYGRIVDWLRTQEGVLISTIQDQASQVVLQSDFDVAPPCHGVPGKYWLRLIVGPPIRAAQFVTRVMPRLLDNCPRVPT